MFLSSIIEKLRENVLKILYFFRKPQYNMALDVPLNLFHCTYDLENNWVYDQDELRNVIIHLQNEWTIHSVK